MLQIQYKRNDSFVDLATDIDIVVDRPCTTSEGPNANPLSVSQAEDRPGCCLEKNHERPEIAFCFHE